MKLKNPISSSDPFSQLRLDCLNASAYQTEVRSKLKHKSIALTGGTGFLGTWIAEMISTLNDEYSLNINLDLYARNTSEWAKKYPHLSSRTDISLYAQDVRSSFQFHSRTNFVVHAAGIPNNRIHASDPLRVMQTTVDGIKNTLDAASQLDNLSRFINVSSGLVSGASTHPGAISESDYYPIPSGQLHLVYMDSKRSAESIASIYRSQFRMPISTVRPFTFIGPYQDLNSPWAVNNLLNDAINSRDMRIHGEGQAERSYLYGSDAAWWVLAALINGVDGGIYNIGGLIPIKHLDLAEVISKEISPNPKILLHTGISNQGFFDYFYPDLLNTQEKLGVDQTCSIEQSIKKTIQWVHSSLK